MSSLTLCDDKTKVAKRAELMGDSGLLHFHRLCQFANRAWRFGKSPEDAYPARCREGLDGLSDLAREVSSYAA